MQNLRDQLLAKKLVTQDDVARVEAEQKAAREEADRKVAEEREARAQRMQSKSLLDTVDPHDPLSRVDILQYIAIFNPAQHFTSDEQFEAAAWSFKRWVAEKQAPPDIEHYCMCCGVRGLQMLEARAELLQTIRTDGGYMPEGVTDEEILVAIHKTGLERGQPVALIVLADKYPPNAVLQWLPDKRLYEAMLPLGNWIRHKKLHVCVGCLGQGREASIKLQDAWYKQQRKEKARACKETRDREGS